ncbi:hypothetical protein AALP_AA1G118600 [Arabis alpina]|uniref:Peptidase A1 domain-containing protein n=1 Tax=Arabis alpina TaxID=50452 RepID=A0A087HMM8_ARAAL|nr:hypothetical protein AALP_AA1G118600 [Arabis alpina]
MSSRPTPRGTLSLGGNEKKIIHIALQKDPPAAYALVSVGYPPLEQRLHIDTGLDLTWVLHNPSSGYDPLKSSSFSYKSCHGLPIINSVTRSKIRGQCDYNKTLADKSSYIGTFGIETFTFGKRGLGILKNVLFGFGKTIDGPQAGMGSLGLQLGEDWSIVNSFERKFSICIESFNDIGDQKYFLALGNDAVFTGMKVPLDTQQLKYKISMTSIIIDGESLGIENVLSKYESILDTGTSSISLVSEIYHVVVANITKKMSDAGYEAYEMDNLICYDGTIPKAKEEDIRVAFMFGKVTWMMNTMKMFIQVDDALFCLYIDESPIKQNLIGMPMFQGHNVGFDVPNNKLHIKPMTSPCNKLYDDSNDELDIPNP